MVRRGLIIRSANVSWVRVHIKIDFTVGLTFAQGETQSGLLSAYSAEVKGGGRCISHFTCQYKGDGYDPVCLQWCIGVAY